MSGWMCRFAGNVLGAVCAGALAFCVLVLLFDWAVEDDVRKVEEGRKDWRTMMVLPVPEGRQGAFAGDGFFYTIRRKELNDDET